MKLITEVFEDLKTITEAREDGKKNVYIEGVFLQGGIQNRNGRVYPVETLAKEVDRYNEVYVKSGRALGELGHPEGPQINLDRVSHLIISLRQEENNFIGRAKLIDTPFGSIAKGLVSEGVKLGVSSRGMGSLKLNKEGINEVQNDFYLVTAADIVADPSAPDAFVNGVMEGVEWIWENDLLVAKKAHIAEQTVQTIEKAVSSRELEAKKFKIFENFINKISKLSIK
jgi:hypothetical protein